MQPNFCTQYIDINTAQSTVYRGVNQARYYIAALMLVQSSPRKRTKASKVKEIGDRGTLFPDDFRFDGSRGSTSLCETLSVCPRSKV